MDTPKKLKASQYWEWRTSIVEMEMADKNLKFAQLQHECMLKDLEIARLRAAIFKTTTQTLEDKKNLAKEEYEKYKTKLEASLGMSLSNCVINENFEVNKLD